MATRTVSTAALRRWLAALRCPFAADFDDTDVLAVHRLAHFLEDTHLRHLPESERSALFLPPPDAVAAAADPAPAVAAPAAAPTTATTPPSPGPVSPDAATASLSAYVTALAPTYAGAPAVGRFYSAPAVAAWLTRTALGVAVADAAAAAAADDDAAAGGGGGVTAMDTAPAAPTAAAAAASPTAAPVGGAMDTAAEGGEGPPLPPVVAGAAADPAVRAAAAAVVAACGLAAPPGGSPAAAAASVAARHVLAWQAATGGRPASDNVKREGDEAAAAATTGNDRAPLTLADFPSGIATGDAAVDAVGGVLRLLHAARLARVQRDINDALAAVQATTADAQTDNRLWGRGH